MKIVIDPYDKKSIYKAYNDVIKYQKWVKKKERELLERLLFMGATQVSLGFSRAIYGKQDVDFNVSTQIDGNTAIISVEGESVAFVEFGAGVTYGHGYLGERPKGIVGIGEYGKGKGKNPKGWWYTGDDGKSQHTYGNPPNMVIYRTAVELAEEIGDIAREVFKS